MLDWNSAAHIPFYDPTSSAAPSGFEESTAPSGNLASAMRNWILVTDEPSAPASSPSNQPSEHTPRDA